MERLRQTHAKEVESRDEEVEEIRQSCQKKVRRTLWCRGAPGHAGRGPGSKSPLRTGDSEPASLWFARFWERLPLV